MLVEPCRGNLRDQGTRVSLEAHLARAGAQKSVVRCLVRAACNSASGKPYTVGYGTAYLSSIRSKNWNDTTKEWPTCGSLPDGWVLFIQTACPCGGRASLAAMGVPLVLGMVLDVQVSVLRPRRFTRTQFYRALEPASYTLHTTGRQENPRAVGHTLSIYICISVPT